MKDNKYIRNNLWIGETGPNININDYNYQHQFIRAILPRPKFCIDPWNINCKKLSWCVDNKDGRYSGLLKDYQWTCQSCNIKNPIAIKRTILFKYLKKYPPKSTNKAHQYDNNLPFYYR